MRGYLDLIIIGAIVLAVVGYTAYQRHDAAVAERNKGAVETQKTVNQAVKVKNEIRNRSYTDGAVNERLLLGTW
jgi:hypothetical protein